MKRKSSRARTLRISELRPLATSPRNIVSTVAIPFPSFSANTKGRATGNPASNSSLCTRWIARSPSATSVTPISTPLFVAGCMTRPKRLDSTSRSDRTSGAHLRNSVYRALLQNYNCTWNGGKFALSVRYVMRIHKIQMDGRFRNCLMMIHFIRLIMIA